MRFGPLPDDLVQPLGPGLIAGSGDFALLCRRFDALLERIALRRHACPVIYPPILSRETLERLEYFDSFPFTATPAGDYHVLSPAVCYHCYKALEGRALPSHPFRLTAAGSCARWEGEDLTASPERLWCFTMRELIFFGTPAEVVRECRSLERSLQRALLRAGLQTSGEPAADPFFGSGSARGKFLIQRLKRLKIELRAQFSEGRSIAVASINNHGTFFTERMRISLADGQPAHSGCVAIGLERAAYAALLQRGIA